MYSPGYDNNAMASEQLFFCVFAARQGKLCGTYKKENSDFF